METAQLIREVQAYVGQIYPAGNVQVRGPWHQPDYGRIIAIMIVSALTLIIILILFVARVLLRQRYMGIVGSLVGIAFASGLVQLLASLLQMGSSSPFYDSLGLTAVDTVFGLGIGTLIGLIFGMYPAWLASHQHPGEALRMRPCFQYAVFV